MALYKHLKRKCMAVQVWGDNIMSQTPFWVAWRGKNPETGSL